MPDITELLAAVTLQLAATNEANELQRERIELLESQQQTLETQTAAITAGPLERIWQRLLKRI